MAKELDKKRKVGPNIVNSASKKLKSPVPSSAPNIAPKGGRIDDESDDSMDELDQDDLEDSLDDVDAEDQQDNTNESETAEESASEMKVHAPNPQKNPDANRESHRVQKQQTVERRNAKPHADTLARAKGLWSQLNRKKLPKKERQKLIEELFSLVQSNVVEITFKHDASRVIQAAVKYGSPMQRNVIIKELRGRFVELSKSTYGKFLVVKMLYYGDAATREKILSEIRGNVRKLIKHKEAAYVVEDAFREYTTPAQQEALVAEMYGAEFSVFETSPGMSLTDILADAPEKRDLIMRNLWESIEGSIKKGSVGFTILHRAMLNFFTNANPTERADFIELLKDLVPEFVHTRDGAQVANLVIASSGAKERKSIVKAMKPHTVQAMRDEFGWSVIVTLLMCTDDTVLITKLLGPEIKPQIVTLFEDKSARKVFLYLLAGLDKRHFTAKELAQFYKVNEIKVATSKKDDTIRRNEVLEPLSALLLDTLTENMSGMLTDPTAISLVSEIVLRTPADRTEAVNAILGIFDGDLEGVVHEHTPRFLKTLIQGGHWNPKEKKVEIVDPPLNLKSKFMAIVAKHGKTWATGELSFVVLALLETLDGTEKIELQRSLQSAKGAIQIAADAGNKGSRNLVGFL